MKNLKLLVGAFLLFALPGISYSISVNVKATLNSLIQDEDTDHDKRITIEDSHIAGTDHGDKRFWIAAADHRMYEVSGTYYLSNLLQELTLLTDEGKEVSELDLKRVFELPADRISRSIRELYWDGLTRRIDESGLSKILSDEKTATNDGLRHVYTPSSDSYAYECLSQILSRHPELKAKLTQLPNEITPDYVRRLDGYHGLLTLKIEKSDSSCQSVPFVVPGGRFNEMYGWDSYFIVLGLLQDHRVELARAMVDNFIYEITFYHQILNANRTYYLTRSQPPFLTSMMLAVYAKLPANPENKKWLRQALQASIQEHDEVWMNTSRLTKTGLSRYFDSGYGPPPEVEPGRFDNLYSRYAAKSGMDARTFEAGYKSGKLKVPELDQYFVHDRCMRESGHDTSYRFLGQCADLVTVDLNSLLYKMEMDIATTIEKEFDDVLELGNGKSERSARWYALAEKRKKLMDQYLWNPEREMYFDFDFAKGRRLDFLSPATFFPLWAGLADKAQADALIRKALPLLEMPGGIAGSTEESRGPVSPRRPQWQWDYPNGWSPHQILTWMGLSRYGYESVARRLAYRWLYTITINAAHYNGTVPEKFDVVRRTHQVFAEYGNVGTKFAYITKEGFGWTNASYQIGLNLLSPELVSKLNQLIPPEWIFDQQSN